MNKPGIIDRVKDGVKPAVQSLLGPRGRVALLMAGLATAPACKFSASAEINASGLELNASGLASGSATETTRNWKDIKNYMIPDLGVSIIMGTVEINDKDVLEGTIYVSAHSPLREKSDEIRTYKLPKNVHPLTHLVVEPSGKITARTDGDQFAVTFKCEGGLACGGTGIAPEESNKELIAAAKKIEEEKKYPKHPKAHAKNAKKAEKKDEAIPPKPHAKNDEKHVAKGPAVEGTPSHYTVRKDLEKDFLKLRTALKAAGFAYRVDIIRKHGGKWSKSLEPMIQGFENDKSAAGLANKSNTGEAVLKETLFIVGSDPELFKKIAKDLKVKLDDKKTDPADKKKKPEKYNTAVLELNENNFKTEVLAVKDKPVLVNFWATWCGACKLQAPIIEQLAAELGDRAVIAKLDVDKNPNLASLYRANALPSIRIFYNGTLVDAGAGVHSKAQLHQVLKKYLKKKVKGPNWI